MICMGILAEKMVTVSLTFRIRVTDDVLNAKPSDIPDEYEDDWREQMEEQRRLLLALLAQGGPDLTAVLLDEIAFALSTFKGRDWEQALLGKNSDDDQAFFEGGMMLSTIEAMDAPDRERWKERIQERDEQLGCWFCFCTENLHNCFHVKLDSAHIAESVSAISGDPEDTQEATKT
jgi:hypothetical protein